MGPHFYFRQDSLDDRLVGYGKHLNNNNNKNELQMHYILKWPHSIVYVPNIKAMGFVALNMSLLFEMAGIAKHESQMVESRDQKKTDTIVCGVNLKF